jgi:hypothetical protein
MVEQGNLFEKPNLLQRGLTAALKRALLPEMVAPEYQCKWVRKVTPSGLPIFRLRASARRTSATGCSGWPTPTQYASKQTPEEWEARNAAARAKNHNLGAVERPLELVAQLAGWGTPSARDGKDAGPAFEADPTMVPVASRLPRQAAALTSGQPTTSSPAATARRGVLSPEHSRWLMGYPAAWGFCGLSAIASCRRSGRPSSGRSSKRKRS